MVGKKQKLVMPRGVKWVGFVGFGWVINELGPSKPIAHLDPFNKECITHT